MSDAVPDPGAPGMAAPAATGDVDPLRSRYLSALADAMARPVRRRPDVAVQRFLSLNAAYFLGEWLPAGVHERLVQRLAADLDGLADVSLPDDPLAATQLAQHVRELAAEFGASPWTDRIARMTEPQMPVRAGGWDRVVREAADIIATDGQPRRARVGDRLLLAHARRRMWELTHAADVRPARPVPAWALRLAERAAEDGDGRAIQVAEALLAELAYGGVQL
jgi:hypothetical protein